MSHFPTHFILFISLYSWEVTAQLPPVQVLTGAASSGFWAAAAGWICSAGQALCGKRGRGDHGPTMGQPPCCLLSAAMVCLVGCADQTDVDCVGLCVSTCFDQNRWRRTFRPSRCSKALSSTGAMSRLSSKNACNLNAVIVLRWSSESGVQNKVVLGHAPGTEPRFQVFHSNQTGSPLIGYGSKVS